MPRTTTPVAIASLAALLTGCAPDRAGQDVSHQTESEIVTSYNGDVALLGSYNELFDKSADTACVGYEDGERHARVGEPTRHLSIELVRKKQDLAQKLGVDLNLKGAVGTVSGNVATELLSEFSSNSNTYTYLLTARSDYVVRDQAGEGQSVLLTPAAQAAMDNGARDFARLCGTHYVNAVRYGARFYLLISYKAHSHEAKTQLEASLGINGATTEGDIRARLERSSNINGVEVTVKSSSSGFQLNGQPSAEIVRALESAAVDQNLLSAASTLYFNMAQAVQNEYCLDVGEGTCANEVESPGYFHRNRRDASVTGVQLNGYHHLANATQADTFLAIKERVNVHKRFIRAYSEIQVRMDSIYNDEVKPFIEAETHQQAMYNIAPPGDPLDSPGEVWDVAQELNELIRAPAGGVMGSLREDAHDRLQSCLSRINVDITASCTDGDTYFGGSAPNRELEADETEHWNELYGFFANYHDTKRIVPISVVADTEAHHWNDPQDRCNELAEELNDVVTEAGGYANVVYRPANFSETRAIAPFLSHGNIDWSEAEHPHATWYTGGSHSCGHNRASFFRNEPGGQTGLGCIDSSYWFAERLVTICVPASGPFPLLAPK